MGKLFTVAVISYYVFLCVSGREFWGSKEVKKMPKGQRYRYYHK